MAEDPDIPPFSYRHWDTSGPLLLPFGSRSGQDKGHSFAGSSSIQIKTQRRSARR